MLPVPEEKVLSATTEACFEGAKNSLEEIPCTFDFPELLTTRLTNLSIYPIIFILIFLPLLIITRSSIKASLLSLIFTVLFVTGFIFAIPLYIEKFYPNPPYYSEGECKAETLRQCKYIFNCAAPEGDDVYICLHTFNGRGWYPLKDKRLL